MLESGQRNSFGRAVIKVRNDVGSPAGRVKYWRYKDFNIIDVYIDSLIMRHDALKSRKWLIYTVLHLSGSGAKRD